MKNLTLLLIINILFATQLFADTTTTNITPQNYIDSSIIAKQSGNYQESINYIKKAILLQDTLYNHNYNNEIKILRSSSEIEELYVENKVQKNRILTIIILFASIITIILFICSIILKYQNNRIKENNKLLKESRDLVEESLKERKATLKNINENLEESLNIIVKTSDTKLIDNELKSILSKISLIFIFSLLSINNIKAENLLSLKSRDSIFNILSHMKRDTSKILFLEEVIMNNSNNLYTDDFIKILIYEAKELKMVNKQIKAINIGFRNNLTAGDIEKSKEYLDLLKNVLYDNKRSLNIFYRQWHSYMQLLASNGYSEKVKDQSNIIKKEAIRENSIVGIACADLAHSSAYFFLKDNANAAKILYNTLRSYQLDTTELITIHRRLYNYNYNLKEYDIAIGHLDTIHTLYGKKTSRNQKLEHHTNSASIYMLKDERDSSYKHLVEAQKYYNNNCFISYFVIYHNTWAKHYEHKKDFKKSLNHYDIILEKLGNTQPILKQNIRKNRAATLEKNRMWEQAINELMEIYSYGENLNNEFMKRQAIAIEENYRYEKVLINKANYEFFFKISLIVFILITLIIVTYLLYKTKCYNNKLTKIEELTKHDYQIAEHSFKFRNKLIKNTKILLRESYETIIKYTYIWDIAKIHEIANEMIKITQNIKYVTLLETNEINYKISSFDISKVCYEIIEKYNNQIEIDYNSSLYSQIIKSDYDKFYFMLDSLFQSSSNSKIKEKIEFNLLYEQSGKNIEIHVLGSELGKINSKLIQKETINEINNLFINHFNGEYQVKESNLRSEIIIIYPI